MTLEKMNLTRNTTTPTAIDTSPVMWILLVLQLLIMILAIVGNAIVIRVLTKNPNLLGNLRKFNLNLAILDLFTGCAFITSVLLNRILFHPVIKALTVLTIMFLAEASQGFVTEITFDRFLAICRRSSYERIMTKRNIKAMIGSTYLFTFALRCVQFAFVRGFGFQYHLLFQRWVYLLHASINLSLTIVNVILFLFILRKARRFYKRMNPAILHGANPEGARQRNLLTSSRNGKVMGFVTLCFTICWTPLYLYEVAIGLGNVAVASPAMYTNILIILGLSNSFMNPFIYTWQKKEFRKKCKQLFPCTCIARGQPVTPPMLDSHLIAPDTEVAHTSRRTPAGQKTNIKTIFVKEAKL